MVNTDITVLGLFLEGLLSFFSPCVLPLIPLYIGYLTAGYDEKNPHRKTHTFINTLAFALGICTVFVIAALGSSALRVFFETYTIQFQLFGGFLLTVLGLMSLGVIRIPFLEKDYRFALNSGQKTSFLKAFLMGFCFSFAWSPCIGPLLASAIMAAASASSRMTGFLYIAAYSLGFVIPFLVTGIFTDAVLGWLKNHKNIVKYTGIAGGAVVSCMGLYMLFQANQSIVALQKGTGSATAVTSASNGAETNTEVISEGAQETPLSDDQVDAEKYNFTLKDAEGNEHQLTDYMGKPLLFNFFGTWCGYCNKELPALQKIHDNGEVQVVLIAAPGLNGEGDIEYVEEYMKKEGYSMTILYDDQYTVTRTYGISGYPTTFAMNRDGSFLGYVPGYVTDDMLDQIVEELKAE